MLKKAGSRLFVATLCVLCLLPALLSVSSSFKSATEPLGAYVLPRDFSIHQFESVLLRMPQYLKWFWNSVEVSLLVSVLAIPISLAAGYGFAKFTFPFKDFLFFMYIAAMLMPFQATLVPQYITLKGMGLLDTKLSLVLPGIFSAFGVFMSAQMIKGISGEILEAGKIDGLSSVGAFFRIVAPMSKSAMSALFILLFIDSWGMVEQPLVFLSSQDLLPLSLNLGALARGLPACGVVAMVLPCLACAMNYGGLIEGIAAGSLK
ncbi:MAG: carbohydrate ABC transporter permease [Clostridiales bacterium]|nr:carbohydrate ABC transporter permease [Clostridiales bacterium]